MNCIVFSYIIIICIYGMCACVLVVIVALSGFSFAIVQNYEVPFVSKLYFKTNNKLFKNDSYVGNK